MEEAQYKIYVHNSYIYCEKRQEKCKMKSVLFAF